MAFQLGLLDDDRPTAFAPDEPDLVIRPRATSHCGSGCWGRGAGTCVHGSPLKPSESGFVHNVCRSGLSAPAGAAARSTATSASTPRSCCFVRNWCGICSCTSSVICGIWITREPTGGSSRSTIRTTGRTMQLSRRRGQRSRLGHCRAERRAARVSIRRLPRAGRSRFW